VTFRSACAGTPTALSFSSFDDDDEKATASLTATAVAENLSENVPTPTSIADEDVAARSEDMAAESPSLEDPNFTQTDQEVALVTENALEDLDIPAIAEFGEASGAE